ncbi:MAG TPA: hypothetical protein VF981_03425 [Gemmatimonadaceae bacterium]
MRTESVEWGGCAAVSDQRSGLDDRGSGRDLPLGYAQQDDLARGRLFIST